MEKVNKRHGENDWSLAIFLCMLAQSYGYVMPVTVACAFVTPSERTDKSTSPLTDPPSRFFPAVPASTSWCDSAHRSQRTSRRPAVAVQPAAEREP